MEDPAAAGALKEPTVDPVPQAIPAAVTLYC